MFRGSVSTGENWCPDWNENDCEALFSWWFRHVPYITRNWWFMHDWSSNGNPWASTWNSGFLFAMPSYIFCFIWVLVSQIDFCCDCFRGNFIKEWNTQTILKIVWGCHLGSLAINLEFHISDLPKWFTRGPILHNQLVHGQPTWQLLTSYSFMFSLLPSQRVYHGVCTLGEPLSKLRDMKLQINSSGTYITRLYKF